MLWIAPSEKDTDKAALEKRLWNATDQFRANSGLKSQQYSAPVLDLLQRFAEGRFAAQRTKLEIASAPYSEFKAAMRMPSVMKFETGTLRERFKMIGNAVCPPVMRQVVKQLISENA